MISSIGALIGRTLTAVVGLKEGSDRVSFASTDGARFALLHQQDCCETVLIEDVCGDVADLLGAPILQAEEVSSEPEPSYSGYQDSHTWTFYKLATIKGSVTIRWLGTSNGWYSERVTFTQES